MGDEWPSMSEPLAEVSRLDEPAVTYSPLTEQVTVVKAAFPLSAIIATVVWLLVAVISVVPVLMSVMVFDSAGSQDNFWLVLAFLGLISFPILCVVTIPAVWVVYFLTRTWGQTHVAPARTIRILTALLPLLSVAPLVVGIAGLEVFCSGDFSC